MGKSSVYEEFFRELCRALVVKAIALLIGRSGSWFKSVAKKAREDFETGNYSQEEILRIVSVIYVGTIFLCLFSAGIVVGIYKMRKKLLMLLPLLERFMMLYFVQNLATDFADNVISGFCQSIFSLALPVSLYSGTKVKGVWTSGLCVLTEVICFLWGPGVVAGIFCTLDVVETVDEFEIFVLMRAIKFICSVSWSWTMDQYLLSELVLDNGPICKGTCCINRLKADTPPVELSTGIGFWSYLV
ncbi:unnamed protein product [Allacma fusca]|uniref:Uncharacterized protein n=1 Tax=Allacma fusca TaxID=39272 RepID=A0A8J2PWS9_9HEXA|nr:unnamed protein product [Allacma fusca]